VLRDLRTLGAEVAAVARSDASVARAREGGAAAVVGTLAELDGVAGVVVATTTSTHAAVVEEALGLGVPVFCEKPLCADAPAARRLARLAPERLFVMDKWRYHPGVLALAGVARSGRLGAVRGLRTTRVGWRNTHDDVDAVWVLAPHDLAIALEVLGEVPRPVAAAAVDGSGSSLVGVLAAGPVTHVLEVSERAPRRERRVELHCEEGVATLAGGWDEHVVVSRGFDRDEPHEERVETPGELPLLAELRAFVDHLEGGPPPRSSAAEGAAVVEAVEELRVLAGVA
jgi:predicted dehydrogenase